MNGPRIGVATFPGSLDDRDALRAVGFMGGEPVSLWHADDEAAATAQVQEMATRFLSNPVIEDFQVLEVEPAS